MGGALTGGSWSELTENARNINFKEWAPAIRFRLRLEDVKGVVYGSALRTRRRGGAQIFPNRRLAFERCSSYRISSLRTGPSISMPYRRKAFSSPADSNADITLRE